MTSNIRTDRRTDGHHFLEITRVYGSGKKKKYLHPQAIRAKDAGPINIFDLIGGQHMSMIIIGGGLKCFIQKIIYPTIISPTRDKLGETGHS